MECYETCRIDHLGIVAGICREIGLIEQVDQWVKGSERKVSCGQAVQALVLNALGSPAERCIWCRTTLRTGQWTFF